jgi:hypothetical protein
VLVFPPGISYRELPGRWLVALTGVLSLIAGIILVGDPVPPALRGLGARDLAHPVRDHHDHQAVHADARPAELRQQAPSSA